MHACLIVELAALAVIGAAMYGTLRLLCGAVNRAWRRNV